jgi:hypothetical protein
MEFMANLRAAFPGKIKKIMHLEYIQEYKIIYFSEIEEN